MRKIKQFWNWLLDWIIPSRRKVDKINRILKEAVINQEKEKRKLRRKTLKHFGRQFHFGSKYIKPKGKNREHIFTECEKLFGEEMRKVNLELTHDLQLK